jgi:hypothetical protein
MTETNRNRSDEKKTNIRRLLETLDARGRLDAQQLEFATGISRSVVIATMYSARDRGMVSFQAKSSATLQYQEGEVRAQRSKRGQLYEFVSYEAKPKEERAQDQQDPWDEDLRYFFELTCLPTIRQTIQALESKCVEKRVIRQKDF